MDVRMPNVDGLEATRKLLERDDTGARVLILTTFDLDEYVYEALRAGASGFLLKDTPPEQLVEAIRIVAQGDELLAPSVTCRIVAEFARPPAARSSRLPALDELAPDELELLRQVASGLSNAEIAAETGIERADGEGRRRADPRDAPAPRPGARRRLRVRAGLLQRRRSARTTESFSIASTSPNEARPIEGDMDVAATLTSRLIGTLFVERGLVSESQIRVALEIQRETGEQLGTDSRRALRRVAQGARERRRRAVAGARPGRNDPRRRPARTTRGSDSARSSCSGASSPPEQLDQALQRQRETGERVGEALVAQGAISKFELAGALAEQMAALEDGRPRRRLLRRRRSTRSRRESRRRPSRRLRSRRSRSVGGGTGARDRGAGRPRASRCFSPPRPPRSRRSAAWRSRRRPPATGSSSWAARPPTSVPRSTSRTSASSSCSASADHRFPTTSGPACSSSRAFAATSREPALVG